jgi:hypothetical protein
VVSRLPPSTSRPFKTRFPFDSVAKPLNLADDDKSPDHYAKGTPSGILLAEHSPPTACRHVVSGSVSSPYRGSSHLSLALLCAIGHQRVLSLGRWSSPLRTHFHVLSPTQEIQLASAVAVYGTFTLYGATFLTLPLTARVRHGPTTPEG